MTVSVTRLDHVNITSPDELETEVVTWYAEVLNLERIEKPEGTRRVRGAWFRCGDGEIHVSVDRHTPSKSAHFALVVDDFAAALKHLRDHGSHVEPAGTIPGRRRCFVRDPAGNLVEILAFGDGGASDAEA